jgi:hypothetical protein|tara:strand:+ start:5610 stop:5984 length:375 start_codon:yes stop_codon:yes gene_type:complete
MSSITDSSISKTADSATEVKEFFNSYYSKKISFTSNQVDSVVGFFKKRGFEISSATATATVLLEQSKIDNVNVFKLLDTLEGLSDVAISQLVATILNNNRSRVSSIGYKAENTGLTTENRNIVL